MLVGLLNANERPDNRREYTVVPQEETKNKILASFSGEYREGKRLFSGAKVARTFLSAAPRLIAALVVLRTENTREESRPGRHDSPQ